MLLRRDAVEQEIYLYVKVTNENLGVAMEMAIEAYCMKCKTKKVMINPVESLTKNGKPITKGKCPDCATTICRIGAAK